MTVKLQAMTFQCKSMLGSHFLLEPFDVGRFKLNNLAALLTNEMVVMVLVKHIIINGFVIVEMSWLADANLTQKI